MRRGAIACGAAAALLSLSVQATVSLPTDLPEVVSSATLIVRGRVVDARAFADIANGPVMTAVTVGVTEVLKGSADRFVTFRVHGGDLGRYRHITIGAPTFEIGDDTYLFLKRAPDGVLWTVGMGAGVYKVASGAVSPPVVAGQTATAGAPVVRGDARRKPMGVGEFSSLVRLVMASEAGREGDAERAGRAGRETGAGRVGRAGGGR